MNSGLYLIVTYSYGTLLRNIINVIKRKYIAIVELQTRVYAALTTGILLTRSIHVQLIHWSLLTPLVSHNGVLHSQSSNQTKAVTDLFLPVWIVLVEEC